MVNINIVIRYMAVIATGTHARAALVIVGFENLCLPVSILRNRDAVIVVTYDMS